MAKNPVEQRQQDIVQGSNLWDPANWGKGGLPPPASMTPAQREIMEYNKPDEDALRSIHQQQYYGGAPAAAGSARAALLAAGPVNYGVDTGLGANIQADAMNNPAVSNLIWRANSAQPYQGDLNTAGEAAQAARVAAGNLGGQGAYVGDTQAALRSMGNNTSAFGQDVAQMGRDVGMVRDAAAGNGPSAASALMKGALDSNARNMVGMAAGARGGNVAAGMRAAANAGRDQGLQAINQMAALRANEQLGAMGQLSGANAALAGARGQLGNAAAQRAGAAIGATNAQTGRQAAAAQALTGASGAAANAANAGISGVNSQNSAIANAGQLYGAGVNTAAGVLGQQVNSAGQAAQTGLGNVGQAVNAFNALSGDMQEELNREAGATAASKQRDANLQNTLIGAGFNAAGLGASLATGGKK